MTYILPPPPPTLRRVPGGRLVARSYPRRATRREKLSRCRLGVRDVLAHFDALDDALPDDADLSGSVLERANARLSRRVYKSTVCGAWAEVRREPVVARATETWTARYEPRDDGRWHAVDLSGPADVVNDVREYFWALCDANARELLRLDGDVGTVTESFAVARTTGSRWVFRVGSIVEGTDAEVEPVEVALPCRRRDLTRAVDLVEQAAAAIWRETHGCETCAARQGVAWDDLCPCDPDCPECGGEGVVR